MSKSPKRKKARAIIDESYKELTDKPICPGCGRKFTPRFESSTTCSGACALKLIRRKP